MKLSNRCAFTLAIVLLAPSLTAAPRGTTRNNVQQADPVPQIMVANFFNILVQGAIAIASKDDPEKRLEATAQALNSIANLAQLAMRKNVALRKTDPETTAREIYQSLMRDEEFLQELDAQRPELHAALVATIIQQSPALRDELHSAHVQIG